MCMLCVSENAFSISFFSPHVLFCWFCLIKLCNGEKNIESRAKAPQVKLSVWCFPLVLPGTVEGQKKLHHYSGTHVFLGGHKFSKVLKKVPGRGKTKNEHSNYQRQNENKAVWYHFKGFWMAPLAVPSRPPPVPPLPMPPHPLPACLEEKGVFLPPSSSSKGRSPRFI